MTESGAVFAGPPMVDLPTESDSFLKCGFCGKPIGATVSDGDVRCGHCKQVVYYWRDRETPGDKP